MILVKPSFEVLTPLSPDMLRLLELAGRVCYKSEDKITGESAGRFCKRIMASGHESVIEHVNVTVKFVIDRGVSHELVRHRLASYSQESTRYCNYGKQGQLTFVIPPWVDLKPGDYGTLGTLSMKLGPDRLWAVAVLDAEYKYIRLLKLGWQPQQARSVLPNSLKTEIVMTANLREWKHVFKLRCSKAAHPQMQEIMIPLRDEFACILPEIFE
jgi:thymidylate synthase (FAD)